MASKSSFKISDSLMKKLQEKANQKANIILNEMERQIKDSLGIIYSKVIEDFYDDYDPDYYDRTFSTYQAGLIVPHPTRYIDSPVARTKTSSASTKNGFAKKISMSVTSDNMNPIRTRSNQYRQPIDYVFNRTFEQGIHGYSSLDSSTFATKRVDDHSTFRDVRPPKRMKSDRTPAIHWENAISDFKSRKNGPRLRDVPSSCSLDWIKKDEIAYADRMMR